jgi:anaphase-promoting complex subunit 8
LHCVQRFGDFFFAQVVAKIHVNYSFRGTKLDSGDVNKMPDNFTCFDEESDTYDLAKAYFDLKEYDRSAFFTKGCKTSRCMFLHFYSRFN